MIFNLTYLHFAYFDEASLLLHHLHTLHGTSILEPAEGGRGDPHGHTLKLQGAVYSYGQLIWGPRAGYLRGLWEGKGMQYRVSKSIHQPHACIIMHDHVNTCK